MKRRSASNLRGRRLSRSILGVITLVLLVNQLSLTGARVSNQVQHVVVIMQENHTFDNYFGTFPGANGLQNAPPSVHPFHIDGEITDLCHSWDCAHKSYDDGKMDGFLRADRSAQTFGYYDQRDIPYYWELATKYTLFDNYFTSAMGPSLPNHLYLLTGQSANITGGIREQHGTIGVSSIIDKLEKAHVSWTYYSPYFRGNENPLGLLSSVASNQTRLSHEEFSSSFLTDLKHGRLSQVSWIMADDGQNEHAPYDVRTGMNWVKSIMTSIQSSPFWSSTAIFLTWDDYGGWYDHVPPPQADKFGYGFRVPLIVVSPLTRHGYIDHTISDHTSILRFIEETFNLSPLSTRDARAYNFRDDFAASKAMVDTVSAPHVGAFVGRSSTAPQGWLSAGNSAPIRLPRLLNGNLSGTPNFWTSS